MDKISANHLDIHHSHHCDILLCIDVVHSQKIYCMLFHTTKLGCYSHVPVFYCHIYIFVGSFLCTVDTLHGISGRIYECHRQEFLSTKIFIRKMMHQPKKKKNSEDIITLVPHFHEFCEHRIVFKLDFLHSHFVLIICEHGGHGPG